MYGVYKETALCSMLLASHLVQDVCRYNQIVFLAVKGGEGIWSNSY